MKFLHEGYKLPFYSEEEIEDREYLIKMFYRSISNHFKEKNKAFQFVRVEGPTLCYWEYEQGGETFNIEGEVFNLRPETTASSLTYAQHLLQSKECKAPLCVWQSGKSYRNEKNDGASISKLRFNEFYQLEFQIIYSPETKLDVFDEAVTSMLRSLQNLLIDDYVTCHSDRLPHYSYITIDFETHYKEKLKEICSISQRKDMEPEYKIVEIAIGLDRMLAILNERRGK